MNRTIFKEIGVVIMALVMITTLLSCSNKGDINNEIAKLKISESFDLMIEETSLLAESTQAEQDYFKNRELDNDYEVFAKTLKKSFDQSEADFAKAHNQVLQDIEILKNKYTGTNDEIIINQINEYQIELSALFIDIQRYHYMILETELLLRLFNDKVTSMMTYLSEGNTTSIEYNNGLQLLMENYSEFLSGDSMAAFNSTNLNDKQAVVDMLSTVSNAKSEIRNLHTMTEIDIAVNQYIYEMFDYVEQSVTAMYKYVSVVDLSSYTKNTELKIDEGANRFYNEVMKELKSPF